jgi:hypothetical protein
VKVLRKAVVADSGAWNGRDRDGMMVGVKMRTEGLDASVEALWLLPFVGSGSLDSKGKKF